MLPLIMPAMINKTYNHEILNSYLHKILAGVLSLLTLNCNFARYTYFSLNASCINFVPFKET